MYKGVYQNDMEHRGGAPNLEAQGGFLRGGGVLGRHKISIDRKTVLQLFVLIPFKIMTMYTLWEDCKNHRIMSDAESGLFACLLLPLLPRAVLCCAEISVHAFIRFPIASTASSWLEWVSASCFFIYLIIHIIIFILLLALLVARLGKIRKSRLCFSYTQL